LVVPGPGAGGIRGRPNGSLVADRSGQATGYSIQNLQARGVLFVAPGEDVYEGMIVGENSRTGDLDVNITKAKQMTNVRSNADVLVRLNPPHRMSLDQAIEYIQEGEAVEVTPADVRLRKAVLSASERATRRSKAVREATLT
jgi:GTP-binding protein